MTIRTLGAALALTIVLAGCSSDDGDPTVLPPAPSTSPSAADPLPLPPEAAAETSAGAEAFARYYMDVLNSAYAIADPAAVAAISAPGCGGCDNLMGAIQELQEDGQRSVGGEYRVTSALAPIVVGGDVVVDIAYTRPAGQILDLEGRVIESAEPVPVTNAQLRLVRRDGSWVVQGFRVQE